MGYVVEKVGEEERMGIRGGLEWGEEGGEGGRVLQYREGHHGMLLI